MCMCVCVGKVKLKYLSEFKKKLKNKIEKQQIKINK